MDIHPVEYKVLIRADPVDDMTEGGIAIPQQVRDKEQKAQEWGTLEAVGGNAFEEWEGDIPKPGDRVLFERYGGRMIERDSQLRLCNDKDITAIVRE